MSFLGGSGARLAYMKVRDELSTGPESEICLGLMKLYKSLVIQSAPAPQIRTDLGMTTPGRRMMNHPAQTHT